MSNGHDFSFRLYSREGQRCRRPCQTLGTGPGADSGARSRRRGGGGGSARTVDDWAQPAVDPSTPSGVEHRLDSSRQLLDLERLAEGLDVAVRLELGRRGRVDQGADNEHLGILAVVLANALEDLAAAQLAGQHEVEQDEV